MNRSFLHRLFNAGLVLVFLFILFFAAKQKFSQPLTPIFDPDTPGYLNPALSQLSGTGLLQTQGRSFLYPVLVLGLLKVTGQLESIVVMQHIASLLTAVVWMGVWMVWTSFLPRNAVRFCLSPLIGMAAAALYLWSAETVMFGLQVRPEAVFPLAASLQLLCLMLFIRVRWYGGSETKWWPALASGSGAMLFAAAAYNLKPSWGFAILLSPFVLFLGVLLRRKSRSIAAAAAPLFLGCLLAFVLTVVVPVALKWKPDNASKSFLPMLLFSVHANIISDELQSAVAEGTAGPAEAEFAARLREGIEKSREALGSYKLLGHNPDYLMFGSKTLRDIPGVSTIQERKAYYFRNFFQAMVHQPMRFVSKWLRQLQAAAFQDPKYMCRPSGNLKKLYSISLSCPNSLAPGLRPELVRSCGQVAEQTAALASSLPDACFMGPKWLKQAGVWGAVLYPLALLISFVLLVASIFLFPEHRAAIWTASLVSAAAFMSAMTVAFVHSFDIDRYLSLQSWLAWLTIACWTAVVFSLLENLVRKFFEKQREPLSVETE